MHFSWLQLVYRLLVLVHSMSCGNGFTFFDLSLASTEVIPALTFPIMINWSAKHVYNATSEYPNVLLCLLICRFELGKQYSMTLHIRNISSSSTRLHILPPSTVYFKVEESKKDLCAWSRSYIGLHRAWQQGLFFHCSWVLKLARHLLRVVPGYPNS